jgi:hypothetical protein
MLLGKRTHTAHRAQGDLLPGALHFQGAARLLMQLFPQRFWDDDAAGFINSQADAHLGTLLWVEPSVKGILQNPQLAGGRSCLLLTTSR